MLTPDDELANGIKTKEECEAKGDNYTWTTGSRTCAAETHDAARTAQNNNTSKNDNGAVCSLKSIVNIIVVFWVVAHLVIATTVKAYLGPIIASMNALRPPNQVSTMISVEEDLYYFIQLTVVTLLFPFGTPATLVHMFRRTSVVGFVSRLLMYAFITLNILDSRVLCEVAGIALQILSGNDSVVPVDQVAFFQEVGDHTRQTGTKNSSGKPKQRSTFCVWCLRQPRLSSTLQLRRCVFGEGQTAPAAVERMAAACLRLHTFFDAVLLLARKAAGFHR